jgi:hypothetical protein
MDDYAILLQAAFIQLTTRNLELLGKVYGVKYECRSENCRYKLGETMVNSSYPEDNSPRKD